MVAIISIRQPVADPIVITGIGLATSVGKSREAVWQAVQRGRSGVRRLCGLRGIPDGLLLGATVDLDQPVAGPGKVFPLSELAAAEALRDARVDTPVMDGDRFGCLISGHMCDNAWFHDRRELADRGDTPPETGDEPVFPSTACARVARRFGLSGPRVSYSTACASSLVSVLAAVRAIRDGQCDIALTGGADAIDPLLAAGFHQMHVLADDDKPERACRPFDRNRRGFVLGEGAAMLVVERLAHARRRGARIYAEIAGYSAIAEAHHVTGLDAESETLSYLIAQTLRRAGLKPAEIGYINAHGTGTQQNDLVEMRAIRRAFGPALDRVCVSATKSMLGHMIHAAGGVELAITVLAMRDGFAPPTLNLTDPDPELAFDCLPLVGRWRRFQHALKLSVAFGGHLVGIALSRWNDLATGFAYPVSAVAA